MALVLYQLDGCPHCVKVAEKLDESNIPYETVWTAALHSDRNEVKRVSGQRQVPVLVDDERGVVMPESMNILEYIEKTIVPAKSPA